eukprot:1498010-Pleurochrysis_carterae.AAC.1
MAAHAGGRYGPRRDQRGGAARSEAHLRGHGRRGLHRGDNRRERHRRRGGLLLREGAGKRGDRGLAGIRSMAPGHARRSAQRRGYSGGA